MSNDKSPPSIGNGQRAFWVFLGYTLVGPFFAALIYVIVALLAPLLKLSALLPSGLPPLGQAAIAIFVWSAVPAALAAVGLIPMVFRRGGFGPVIAAAAGVIAFAAGNALAPVPYQDYLPALAFAAGLVSVGVRSALLAGNIILPAPKAIS